MRVLTVMTVGTLLLLGGCFEEAAKTESESLKDTVGSPNPAAVFCVESGGKLELVQEQNGTVGYCHLPDGSIVEEWTYFRANQPLN
ncbi:putative hemolysin [Shewanella algae]